MNEVSEIRRREFVIVHVVQCFDLHSSLTSAQKDDGKAGLSSPLVFRILVPTGAGPAPQHYSERAFLSVQGSLVRAALKKLLSQGVPEMVILAMFRAKKRKCA